MWDQDLWSSKTCSILKCDPESVCDALHSQTVSAPISLSLVACVTCLPSGHQLIVSDPPFGDSLSFARLNCHCRLLVIQPITHSFAFSLSLSLNLHRSLWHSFQTSNLLSKVQQANHGRPPPRTDFTLSVVFFLTLVCLRLRLPPTLVSCSHLSHRKPWRLTTNCAKLSLPATLCFVTTTDFVFN
jgi:hypothetical protein